MHRSIKCIIIFFQWLQFILKIRCKYHHLTTHRCFQGSQLRTQHWTVHSQKILWTIMGCTNNNGRCCLYSLITQRGYWCSNPYRFIVNLILEYKGEGELEQLDGAAQAGFGLLSIIIDPYINKMNYQKVLFSWEEEITCCSASKTHTEKTVTRVN